MNNICVNCKHFKSGGIRDEDCCKNPYLVTIEIHNAIYGGVTYPKIRDARANCVGNKFEQKISWIDRIKKAPHIEGQNGRATK
jgi:hypothetical protein